MPMTFYRLRPGVRHPAFRAGELYRFIEETQPPGYIFLELDGKRRCVAVRDFERVDSEREEGSVMTWHEIRFISPKDGNSTLARLRDLLPLEAGSGFKLMTDSPDRRGLWSIYINELALAEVYKRGFLPLNVEPYDGEPPITSVVIVDR